MLDGVEWAAAEIVFYMLLATLIGFAIAYVFIRWFQTGSIAESFEAELAAQQELTRKAEHRLVESNEALDKVHLELRGEQQHVGKLEAELESARAALAEIEAAAPAESELTQLQTELEASRSEAAGAVRQIAELETAAADRGDAVAKLEQDLAAARGEGAELRRRIAELETAAATAGRDAADRADVIAKLEQELVAEREEAAALQQRVADLESALAECNERRDELESRAAELATASMPVDTADTSEPVPDSPSPVDEEGPSQEEGLARIAEIAARTAGGSPAADDDLKRVHGIGPKLERTLKGLGITSFRQIANFTADDIAYVTAALDAFKGRIERDDWMGSAAAEHSRKYGEPA